MDETHQREVAEALEATPELLPLLPELLADVWVLGADPEVIVDLLGTVELPEGSTALDLACGKGAVALPLARELGLAVRGVDLFLPFVEEARERARRMGLDDLCRFEAGDLRETLRTARDFDVVVYASVGALGRHDRCVAALRRAVRHGGYIVVNDGFLAEGATIDGPGYGHYAGRDEIVRRLTAHGDELLREVVIPAERMAAYNRETTEQIRRRAESLTRRRPEVREPVLAYVERQERECETLEAGFVGAAWLLEKGAD